MKFLLPALLIWCACGWAAEEPTARPPMREVAPGIYEIGKIRLEQKERRVSFPAKVNKAGADDLLEYLLVNEHGQTHESLLFTEIEPGDLHFAMLLLGAKGDPELKQGEQEGGQINAEFLQRAPKLKGDRISISARWKAADGTEKTAPVEDWILNLQTKRAMIRGPWLYTGSSFLDGHFRAQQEGCFAALVTYPPALINNPRAGNDQDDIWAVNAKAVPPLETALEVIIQFEAAPPEPPKK